MSARVILTALLLAAPLASQVAAQDRTVRGTVADAAGKPAAGVEVGITWIADNTTLVNHKGATTAADGTFAVAVPGWMAEAGLLAYTPDRKRGAFLLVDPKADTPAALKLGPTAEVSGNFTCTELGRKLGWTNVYIHAGKNARPLQCSSDKAEFRFPLPAGRYTFQGYGADVVGLKRSIAVTADGPPLTLGAIDLKATAVAKMVGKPPLPWTLADARGLPKSVTPADLKGKWVLLDFWGHWCGPCVQGMVELMELHDLYADHRDKFEIVALHDSSVKDFAEMDQKLVPIKKGMWAGRDLPFPVLLDADRKTAEAYTIQGWPTTILIDPAGNVVGEDHAGRLLASKLPPLPPGVRAGRALDKMAGLGLDDDTLAAAVTLFGRVAGLPVKLDDAAIKAKGVDPAAALPLKMQGSVTLRSWLELALAGTGLVAKVDGNGLVITAGDWPAASKAQAACAEHLREVLSQPVGFDLPAGTLAGLCQALEEKTRENFVLDPAARRAGVLDPKTAVPAAKADNKPLAELLAGVLGPLGLEAVVRCEVVVVRPKGPTPVR